MVFLDSFAEPGAAAAFAALAAAFAACVAASEAFLPVAFTILLRLSVSACLSAIDLLLLGAFSVFNLFCHFLCFSFFAYFSSYGIYSVALAAFAAFAAAFAACVAASEAFLPAAFFALSFSLIILFII